MCGIIGYVGDRPASSILIEGLKRLEYRGYDSAGIAVYRDGGISLARAKGKISELEKRLAGVELKGTPGIGHTRWATHGKPSDENAHPHRSERVVVVHNGIIENHVELRARLKAEGFAFQSETDTEIVPFLIESHLKRGAGLEEAVRGSLREIRGTFALAIFSSAEPDKIIAAKNSSPLILGFGQGENFVASDIAALLDHTRKVLVLDDGEMAVITRQGCRVTDFAGTAVTRSPREIPWSRAVAEKEGYRHFMLKEIHEQPTALVDTLRGRILETEGRVSLEEAGLTDAEAAKIARIALVACGTSWHAALTGKFWIESLARIPTEVDLASEYRYRNPIADGSLLFVPISQSGETADTLAALEEAKRLGANTLAICNVVESSIARRAKHVLYTHAGPEIGVASTKAFTTQLAVLTLLALDLAGRCKTISPAETGRHLKALLELPAIVEKALKCEPAVIEIAKRYVNASDFLYLGRGTSFPIALEGALKLKEISYIHAEGYTGGEIKHGPIALIDEKMPVVAIATAGPHYPKMQSNVEEVLARGAQVIAVVSEGDRDVRKLATAAIEIPACPEFVRPIVETVPLQLLAYHLACLRGTDVDQPRNLAKSVTVE
jgi:glucosamine--fructose-6-phosphate aminotransferase (isomerizing)